MNGKADQSLLMRQARVKKIPTGWKLSTVGEVCSIRNDLRKPISLEEREKIKGQYPYYGPTGVLNYINEYRLDGKFALIGEDGDHFLKYRSWSQTQLVEGKANVNNHAHVIESTPICSVEWFRIFFEHRDLTDFLTRQGAGRFKLNKATLQQLPILIPPIHEQKRIAEILATWNEAITLTEREIEAKQKCKRGFLQQIFKSESYKTFELNEFVDLRREKFNPSPDDDRVCIELEHLSQGTGQLVGSTRSSSQNSTKNVFKPGDVLFGKLRPYLRKFANPNFEGVCSTEIWVLKVKLSLCTSRYLFYLVQTHEFISIANKTSGSKMPRADWGLVAEHPFPLPSLTEQKKIANFLDSLSNEIMLLQSLKDKLESQKRGLMQKLLSGKWRVGIQEAA